MFSASTREVYGNWSQAPHLKLDEMLQSAPARANFKALALELEKIGADMGVKNITDKGRPKPPLK